MSSKRLVVLCTALALAVVAALAAQDARNDPGPLERRANLISPENPVPRRSYFLPPAYPAEAQALDASGSVTLRLTLDEAGQVGEARRMNNPVVFVPPSTPANPTALQSAADALVRSAVAAVRQWQYDPPADGPISFNVTISFRPGSDPVVTQDNTPRTVPPPPPPAPEPRQAAGDNVPGSVTPAPVRVGGQIRAPIQTRRVSPVYPSAAQAERIQGVVILEAVIGPDGRVQNVHVLRSIPALDQAATDAVRQWEYTPTMLNGVPVPVIMTVTVQFTLP